MAFNDLYSDVYQRHSTRLGEELRGYFSEETTPIVRSLFENKKLSRTGYNSFKKQVPVISKELVDIIMERAMIALSDSILWTLNEYLPDSSSKFIERTLSEVFEEFISMSLFSIPIEGWGSWIKDGIEEALLYSTFPGRSMFTSLKTLERAITVATYPQSALSFGLSTLRSFVYQAYRDTLPYIAVETGRGRLRLKATHDNPVCKALQGEYDIRFLPEIPTATCTCRFDFISEPREYPHKVYVNDEPLLVPTKEDIDRKERTIRRLRELRSPYTYLLSKEQEFLEEAYDTFSVEDKTPASFSDEIEVIASYIYGGEVTTAKTPVDVITPVFGIEAKAVRARKEASKERGYIAGEEVVRKYKFLEELARRGVTQGHHKYVLGVFDAEEDKVTVYEQNYFSSKNSATMLPVAVINNYSKVARRYESTPFRTFKVSSIHPTEKELKLLRSSEELQDSFFWEVVVATTRTAKVGDIVEHFDGDKLRRGSLINESASLDDRKRIRRSRDEYLKESPRRGTYSLPTTVEQLRKWMTEEVLSSPKGLTGEWDIPDAEIILEFENLHLISGYKTNPYRVDYLTFDYLTGIFLSQETFPAVSKMFKSEGIALRAIESLRRKRRRTSSGLLEYDVIVRPHFPNRLTIEWEDREIESIPYREFNKKYRLLKQGKFETLSERGLDKIEISDRQMSYEDKVNLLERASNLLG